MLTFCCIEQKQGKNPNSKHLEQQKKKQLGFAKPLV